jgi:hypothetical protein
MAAHSSVVHSALTGRLRDVKDMIYREKVDQFYLRIRKAGSVLDELNLDTKIIKEKKDIIITTSVHPLLEQMEKDYNIYKNHENGYKIGIKYQRSIPEEDLEDNETTTFDMLEWEFYLSRDDKEINNFWWRGGFFLAASYYECYSDIYNLQTDKIGKKDGFIYVESDRVYPDNLVICVPK